MFFFNKLFDENIFLSKLFFSKQDSFLKEFFLCENKSFGTKIGRRIFWLILFLTGTNLDEHFGPSKFNFCLGKRPNPVTLSMTNMCTQQKK